MTDWKSRQNHDGGWPYNRGCSWTEPTALVLLAQSAVGANGVAERQSFDAGLRFLRSTAAPDGGWRPQPDVAESTWVTSAVTLLPEESIGSQQYRRGIEWLKGQTGRESSWSYRLRQRLAGNRDEFPDGWPWFPGAAAWVTPTSFGTLAFSRALRLGRDRAVEDRIDAAREFLLSHMCADGGWNHGSNRALGRDGDSYPETTGIALLALNGLASAQIERAREAARRHLRSCRSAEGVAWLRMALAAHGERPAAGAEPVCRTVVDEALMAIASAPRNPLL
jgi:squalene cyclase